MFAVERRNKIIDILAQKGSVRVGELSRLFKVTEETVRRDLNKLQEKGMLKKTHGGAVLDSLVMLERSFQIRSKEQLSEKTAIAKAATAFVEPRDVIFLDASTTALQVAKHLPVAVDLVVISNAIEVTLELANRTGVRVICTGGTLRGKSLSLVGSLAEQFLQRYNINKAFISCQGFSIEKGATDTNELEAYIKEKAIEAAKSSFLLVDYNKFGVSALVTIAGADIFDYLITDKKAPSIELEKIRHLGVEVLTV